MGGHKKQTMSKLKPHEVTLTEFQDWHSKEEVLFASSSRENKRLYCSLNGNIKILVAGEVVWQGIQPFSAVEAYNAITEKYVNPLANFRV